MNRYSGKFLYENCKLMGRCFVDKMTDVLYMDWSASAVSFCIRGSAVTLDMQAIWAPEYEGIPGDTTAPFHKNWPWIEVFVDGTSVCKMEVNEEQMTKTVWSSDSEGEHEVKIVKLTENYKTQFGLAAVEVEESIEPKEYPVRPRVEFVGDSITCGFGNMTMESNRFFYTEDENALYAHGPLAAEMLGVDYSLVSVSGICAITNKGLPMEYAMEELYEYTDKIIEDKLDPEADRNTKTYEKFDFKKFPNDVVVLNLGTNDGTGMFMSPDDKEELLHFYQGYKKFIGTIRECNGPDTQIVCALGTMNYYLLPEIMKCVEEYKAETGDEKVTFFRYRGMHPMDGLGACAHPSKISQEKMANEIAEVLKGLIK